MCAAAKSVGCVICSVYNRSVLSGVVSGFHELTPCLVFSGRRVSPTILRSTTTAPVWVYYGSKR